MFRRSPIVIALVLLGNAAVGRWAYTRAALDIDYFTQWGVAHVLSRTMPEEPVPNIYEPSVQREMGSSLIAEARGPSVGPLQARATQIAASLYDGRLDATGTPFAYALVGLVSSDDFAAAAAGFQFFSLLCFVAALALLLRLLHFPGWAAVLCFVFFGFQFTPIRADVRVANVNEIQLLALALFIALAATQRSFSAGVCLGLGIALKPNLVLVAVAAAAFALISRDFRRLGRTVGGVLAAAFAAVAVSVVYFGRASLWWDFVRSVPATVTRGYPRENGNYAFAALVSTWTDLPLAEIIVTIAAVVLVVAMLRRRRQESGGADAERAFHESFLAAGAGVTLMLLGSRLAWLHYYALTIPIALYLLRPLGDGSPHQPDTVRAAASWWLALFAVCCLSDGAQQLSTAFGESVMVNLAALLLFAGTVHALRWVGTQPRLDPAPKSPRRSRKGSMHVPAH